MHWWNWSRSSHLFWSTVLTNTATSKGKDQADRRKGIRSSSLYPCWPPWNTPSYFMRGWGANRYPPRDLWPFFSEHETRGCAQNNWALPPWESCSYLTASICFGTQAQIPLQTFFWENKRPRKKMGLEKLPQIRCLFSRFQNPPDIRKTLVNIDGNYIFGNTKFKHV